MTVSQEQLDKLARVVDPESWKLYDMKDVYKIMKPELREQIVYESRLVATRIVNSGLMASLEWDRAEYIQAMNRIREHTSTRGHCYSVENGLDGYFVHDPQCTYWPRGAVGGSGCVKG